MQQICPSRSSILTQWFSFSFIHTNVRTHTHISMDINKLYSKQKLIEHIGSHNIFSPNNVNNHSKQFEIKIVELNCFVYFNWINKFGCLNLVALYKKLINKTVQTIFNSIRNAQSFISITSSECECLSVYKSLIVYDFTSIVLKNNLFWKSSVMWIKGIFAKWFILLLFC